MSAVPNAPRNVPPRTIKSTTRKSGRVKRGGKPEIGSSSPIQSVPTVNQLRKSRITPMSMSMGRQIIWYYQERRPYVNPVIRVDMPDDSNVHLAARLAVNPKVTSAIVACLEVIENELSIAENTGNDSKTKAIRSTGNGLKKRSKTNRSHLPALARLDECCGGV